MKLALTQAIALGLLAANQAGAFPAQPQAAPAAASEPAAASVPAEVVEQTIVDGVTELEMAFKHDMSRLAALREFAVNQQDAEQLAELEELMNGLESKRLERLEAVWPKLGPRGQAQLKSAFEGLPGAEPETEIVLNEVGDPVARSKTLDRNEVAAELEKLRERIKGKVAKPGHAAEPDEMSVTKAGDTIVIRTPRRDGGAASKLKPAAKPGLKKPGSKFGKKLPPKPAKKKR